MANEIYIQEFEDLKDYLRDERRGKVKSGGRQVVIRCPWCGDSRDPFSAHLYIGPNKKRGLALSYYCFLCGRGQAIDREFFRMIDCYDMELIGRVLNYNDECREKSKRDDGIIYVPRVVKPKIDNMFKDEPIDIWQKLNYINDRLGVKLTFADLSKFKIVLNLERYIRDNHIKGITRERKILDELSIKHIGFLSLDNTYMIMRAVVDPSLLSKTIRMRYTNYLLILNKFYSYTYYAIPTMIDTAKEVHLHITEGCFDCLGVYFHCDKSNRTGNEIFSACSGKTFFFDLLKYFIVYMHIPGCICTLDMYIDREKDGTINIDDKMQAMMNRMEPLVKSFRVHVNSFPGEKDFGVPGDRIIDEVIYDSENNGLTNK